MADNIPRYVLMPPAAWRALLTANWPLYGSAHKDLRQFAVRVDNGQIGVCKPNEQAAMDELPALL